MSKPKERSGLVVQSNDLVEAYYDMDLTVTEHKIIRYVASKIKFHDTQFPDYSFEVREFANAAGVKGNNYHAQIEKIADELTKRRIKVKSKEKIGWFPWFSAIIYEKGIVHISFNPLIKDLLLRLEGRFTNYPFEVISPLRSGHSLRIFELLKQYEKIGSRTIEIDELRAMLGITDKYPEYSNFKQRVLKQAQKELDKKTKLSFTFDEIKRGRKVTAIKFNIISKYKEQQLTLFEDDAGHTEPNSNEFVNNVKRRLKTLGIFLNEDIITEWEPFGEELVMEAIDEMQGRDVTHHAKYIWKVINELHKEKKQNENENINKIDEMERIKAKIISKFSKSRELVPDWIIKEEAVPIFMDELSLSKDEALELWEKEKKEIYSDVVQVIKGYTQKKKVRKNAYS